MSQNYLFYDQAKLEAEAPIIMVVENIIMEIIDKLGFRNFINSITPKKYCIPIVLSLI